MTQEKIGSTSMWGELRAQFSEPGWQIVIKLTLAALFIAAGTIMWGAAFAIHITIALLIHEYGHVVAMRSQGVETSGFYFVPILGGAAIAKHMTRTRKSEVVIFLGGPAAGAVGMLVTLVLYFATGFEVFYTHLGIAGLINAFNLLPVVPLDGGRVVHSILSSFGRWTTTVLLWGMIGLTARMFYEFWGWPPPFWLILMAFGCFQLYALRDDDETREFNASLHTSRVEIHEEMIVSLKKMAEGLNMEVDWDDKDRWPGSSLADYENRLAELEIEYEEMDRTGKLPAVRMRWYESIAALMCYAMVIFGIAAIYVAGVIAANPTI